MTNLPADIFRRRRADWVKLAAFGFVPDDGAYLYRCVLPDSGFVLTVRVSAAGELSTGLVDPTFNEPYTLHMVDGAVGAFVGQVRSQYEQILTQIADSCFEPDVFKGVQTQELIAYVRQTYGGELEFLWNRFPDNAVWRRPDTRKWYGAVLTVSRQKLGLAADGTAEIIDLRCPPEEMATLLDGQGYFPGYHMNKKHWFTIILDGSVDTAEICRRLDISYTLALK